MAILLVITLILALLVLSFWMIIPRIINSGEALITKLQSDIILDFTQKIKSFFNKHFHNPELAKNVLAGLNSFGIKLLGSLEALLKSVGSFLASVVIIPVVTFFLIKDSRQFKKALISKVPNQYFELSLNILHKTGDHVTKYIQGQAIAALIVGILSIISLFIINRVFHNPVPYFVFVGNLHGLLNIIPYIGPIVGVILALALTILNSPANLGVVLLWVAIVFILIQVIDNVVITPLVISKSIDMHPP